MTSATNSNPNRSKKVIFFILKTLIWIITIPMGLVILLVIALQFSAVQSFAVHKATAYLSSKIHSRVELQKISISFPKSVSLSGLYVEDKKKDTLFYGQTIKADLNLWDLFSKKIVLNSVELENLTGHISRSTADGKFNFSFIPDAFASKDTAQGPSISADTASAWLFNIKQVSLKHIYFTYHDRSTGVNADLVLGSFDSKLDAFDLNKKIIHVNSIALKNTRGSFVQNMPLQPADTSASQPFDFDLALKTLKLDTIQATYSDTQNGQYLNADLGKFLLDVKRFDLKHEQVELNTVLLHGSEIQYTQSAAAAKPKPITGDKAPAAEKAPHSFGWTLALNTLDIENNTLGYNNTTKAPVKNTVDFNHLLAKQFTIKGKNIYASVKKTKLDLDAITFVEQSGFALKKFQAKLVYDSVNADLSGLHLQTNNSQVNDHLGISYRSLQQLADSIQAVKVNFSFEKTSIALKDVLYFAPEVSHIAKLKDNKNLMVKLDGKMSGTLDDLTVSKFEVHTAANTSLKVSGSVKHLTDAKNLYASAKFTARSSNRDIRALVQDSLIPKSISIPESFSATGSYTGYLKNFDADVDLKSTIGDVKADVKMNPKAGNTEQPYSGKVSTDNFDLGKLLNQPQTFGVVTMSAAVKGSGFDTSNLKADITLAIQKAVFKKYPYSNFSLDGTVTKHSFTGKADMNDNNLSFNYNGTIDLEPASPKYTFTLDLNGADLKALNLSEKDLRVSMLVQSDIAALPGENPTGKASIKNMLVIRENHKYPVDSLVLTSDKKEGVSNIHLQSEIFNADFTGTISVGELPEQIAQNINSYFNFQSNTESTKALKKQNFKFDVQLTDPSLIVGNLVPKLQKLTPFAMKGSYDSEAKDIEMHLKIPQVQYDSIMVDSLGIDISSDTKKLSYNLKIAEVSNPTLKFENLFLGGDLQNNALTFKFNTAKDDSAKLLDIGGVLKSMNREFELKLDPDLIINTQKWNIDNSNYIHFTQQGLYANNLSISNGGQSLSLDSKEKTPASPLEITFKNFEITTLSRLIENKKDLASGTINGNVILEKQNGASAFRSDIEIKNFLFQSVPIGTIKLKADNFEDPNKYDVDLGIEGSGNTITMKGYYSAAKNSELNFILDINHLNLASVEPFTFNQVTRMSGAINGKLNIKGPISAPQINGDINFKEAAFRPRLLSSYLTVHDSKLSLDGRKVRFNNFVMSDSLKHKASLDGTVDISNLQSIALDLRLKTDDFLAMNTNRHDNNLYYGTVILDSDIKVKGTADAPVVSGKLKLNKGTTLTYIKPVNQITKNETKGIVEFVNKHPERNIDIMARRNDSTAVSGAKGIDLSASIDIDKNVILKMIVDPESGDSLYIKGGGLLDFGLDPSGKTSLSGKYRISDGGYYLALEGVVKRNFKIQKGSTVTWTGDMLDAYVDMTAIYAIKTTPLDLVQDELNGADELEKNKYRNQLGFEVFLKMSGYISAPQISFDIQLKPEDRGALGGAVNSKLGELRLDETQLNKQVFALLTLGRFIGENPLESSSDGGLSSASRSSASKVLTQQLSNLSSKYISFVNLDLGVNSYEDYSTGQEQGRTQLQLGVSKQLFKDRVTVRVGGNVDLEGERASQNDINDVAGDVNVDYKLTEDGRYKLKGFRENQYENPIEGELTRTGAGVAYVRNFNTFKQLLTKPPKRIKRPKVEDKDENKDNDEDK